MTTAKFRSIQRSDAQADDDPFEFIMSDGTVDRVGDVIEPSGWELATFRQNPIALYGHDRNGLPIGMWQSIRVEGGKLLGRLKLAEQGTSAFIDAVRALVKQRILRAVSVGFKPLETAPLASSKSGGTRFIRQELLECSLVAVPANANALAVLRGFTPEVRSMVFDNQAPMAKRNKTPALIRAEIAKNDREIAAKSEAYRAAQERLARVRYGRYLPPNRFARMFGRAG